MRVLSPLAATHSRSIALPTTGLHLLYRPSLSSIFTLRSLLVQLHCHCLLQLIVPDRMDPLLSQSPSPHFALPATRLSQHPTGHERHFLPHSDNIQHQNQHQQQHQRTARGARCPAPSLTNTTHSLLLHTTTYSTNSTLLCPRHLRPLCYVLRPHPATTGFHILCSRALLYGVRLLLDTLSIFCYLILESRCAITRLLRLTSQATQSKPRRSQHNPVTFTIASSAQCPLVQRQDVIAPAQCLQ